MKKLSVISYAHTLMGWFTSNVSFESPTQIWLVNTGEKNRCLALVGFQHEINNSNWSTKTSIDKCPFWNQFFSNLRQIQNQNILLKPLLLKYLAPNATAKKYGNLWLGSKPLVDSWRPDNRQSKLRQVELLGKTFFKALIP